MSNETRPPRPGEEIDPGLLRDWLAEHVPDFAGCDEPLVIEQFPGGHSNLTYLVRCAPGDGRELVLRRPPFGSKVKSAHDMGREHRILSRLWKVYPKAPRAFAVCDDLAVIGAPFYVMERVRGVILRNQNAELPPPAMRRLSEAAVDGLAELHAVDFAAAGLGDLGRPQGYVERQVTGWHERWKNARTDDVPDVDRSFAWLVDHLPSESGAALIHNDYKYDNLVLAPDLSSDGARIVAVLDWEMATVGDPLMDLGTSLGYWVDPDDDPAMRALPAGPTTVPGNLTRAEVAERYAGQSGRDVAQILFHYVYGLLKISVIAQQIYFRYKQGLTHDERFAAMIVAVRLFGRQAAQAIERGRI